MEAKKFALLAVLMAAGVITFSDDRGHLRPQIAEFMKNVDLVAEQYSPSILVENILAGFTLIAKS